MVTITGRGDNPMYEIWSIHFLVISRWGFLCQGSSQIYITHWILMACQNPCLSWRLHTGTGDTPQVFKGGVSPRHWHNARIRKKKLWQSSKHLNISQLSRKLHFMSINPWLLQISWVIPPGLPDSHPALWAERAIAAVSWASQAVRCSKRNT